MTLILDTFKQEKLYIEYYPKVLGYITNRINDRNDAEDLASTVFLKVLNKLSEFDDKKASVSTWIYTITRNTLIDYFRTNRASFEISENEVSPDSVEDSVLDEELLKMLASALEKLEERERDVIVLHYYKEKTLADIADLMDISYSYAKVLHKKAIEKLKTVLK